VATSSNQKLTFGTCDSDVIEELYKTDKLCNIVRIFPHRQQPRHIRHTCQTSTTNKWLTVFYQPHTQAHSIHILPCNPLLAAYLYIISAEKLQSFQLWVKLYLTVSLTAGGICIGVTITHYYYYYYYYYPDQHATSVLLYKELKWLENEKHSSWCHLLNKYIQMTTGAMLCMLSDRQCMHNGASVIVLSMIELHSNPMLILLG